MNKLQTLALALLATFGLATAVVAPSVGAIDVFKECRGQNDTAVCKAAGTDRADSIIRDIISALLWALGAIAVIMIVVGGIKYATSNGDANKIQSAKNTIMYSVVGLVVAIIAQAIVLFVVNWLL